jgi:hypothetical protein
MIDSAAIRVRWETFGSKLDERGRPRVRGGGSAGFPAGTGFPAARFCHAFDFLRQIVIVELIVDKKADYVLALKGNHDDVELFTREQKAVAFKNTSVSRDTTVDGDHGRIETRTVTVFHDTGRRTTTGGRA